MEFAIILICVNVLCELLHGYPPYSSRGSTRWVPQGLWCDFVHMSILRALNTLFSVRLWLISCYNDEWFRTFTNEKICLHRVSRIPNKQTRINIAQGKQFAYKTLTTPWSLGSTRILLQTNWSLRLYLWREKKKRRNNHELVKRYLRLFRRCWHLRDGLLLPMCYCG